MRVLACLTVVALTVGLAACSSGDSISNDGGGPVPINGAVNGLSAALTGDPTFGVVAAHTDGNMMAVRTSADGTGAITQVLGAIFTASNGTTVAMDIDNNGLPVSGFISGNAFVIGDFGPTTVEVGVIVGGAPPTITLTEIPYDTAVFQQLAALVGFVPTGETSGPGLSLVSSLQIASLNLVLLGGVIQNVPAAALPASALPAGQVLPINQSLFGVINNLSPGDETIVQQSGSVIGMVACGSTSSNPTSCINMALNDPMTGASTTNMNAMQTAMDLDDEIQNVQGAFMAGTGDVQVTLFWDQAVDLDLMVTDPQDCTVAFFTPTCPSGGMLDFDDTDGVGPQNVFWPPMMAPVGTYTVVVSYFSGTVPTNYTVLTLVEGQTSMFSGTLNSPNDQDTVTMFTVVGSGSGVAPPQSAQ